MQVLRTPDERFTDLPDFGWTPHYAEVASNGDSLRMAYIDEGPKDARPVLLLHGEPSWSYLYRWMIPVLLDAGLRTIAPDLVGFGRSDKPADREDYTYARHVDWLSDLVVDQLDLQDAVLFCQDWGGLLGLRLVAAHPDRFAAVVAANTMLPTGDHDPGEAFKAWREFSQSTPDLPIGQILNGGSARELSPEEIAAYEAPYPDASYKAGACQFPTLVPISPDDPEAPANRKAWETLSQYDKPFVCAWGAADPIMRGVDDVLKTLVKGAEGQPHEKLEGVAHFCQEDGGQRLAEIIVETVQRL